MLARTRQPGHASTPIRDARQPPTVIDMTEYAATSRSPAPRMRGRDLARSECCHDHA